MKKLAMGIAAASLAAVSMSVTAWWGPGHERNYGGYAPYYAYAPYGTPNLTEEQIEAQREAIEAQQKAALEHFQRMEESRNAMRGPMADGPFGMRDPMGDEHFKQMEAQREAMQKAMEEERRNAMRGPMADGPFGMRDPMGEEHFKQMEAQRLAMQESMEAQRNAMQKSFEERMRSRRPMWDNRYGPVR